MSTQTQTLAIHGGEPTVSKSMIKPWPPVDDLDRKYVLQSLESGKHTVGDQYNALNEEFARYVNLKHAVFCNSGTAALHMALVACGVGCGDEVIVPAYTWPSSATCCLHHNAIPVFVDIDWQTMNIDPGKIEAAITPRTKAIVAVHLHGLMVEMDRVMAIAKKHGLMVIEDSCQAHGAKFKGRAAGSFGDVVAYSTNQNKCHCSGEGGFFASNSQELFERGKTLWYFGEHVPPQAGTGNFAYGMGWMYRSTDLTAAFARAQLTKLPGYLEVTRENALELEKCLANVPNLILPHVPEGHKPNYYNYTIRFDMQALGHEHDAAAFRDKLVKALVAEGVDTGVWQGWPVPEMTAIAAKNAYGQGCPWQCTESQVSYDLKQYPIAVKHCNWHTGMTMPLRPPNGKELARAVASAWEKVMVNVEQVEKVE